MTEMIQRAEQIQADVSRNLTTLTPAVRMMAGESLRPVLAMSELLVDMAGHLQELVDELEEAKNGKL